MDLFTFIDKRPIWSFLALLLICSSIPTIRIIWARTSAADQDDEDNPTFTHEPKLPLADRVMEWAVVTMVVIAVVFALAISVGSIVGLVSR